MSCRAGVLTRNNLEEASNAAEDEEHRVVDEEEAPASRVPAEGPELRAAAMGGDARGRWVRDDTEPAGRPP